MKQRDIHAINMFRAVLKLFEEYPAVWGRINAIVAIVEKLKGIVSAIDLLTQKKVKDSSSGYIEKKEPLFDEFVQRTYKLSSKVRAFAKANKNKILLADVNHSVSSLTRGSQTMWFKRALVILSRAKQNLEELAVYDVTQADVDAVDQSINAVAPLIAAHNALAWQRKVARGNVPKLVHDGRAQLLVLDDLVGACVEDENFAESYFRVMGIDRSTGGGGEKRNEEFGD